MTVIASVGGFTTQQIKCINSTPWTGFFAEIRKQGSMHPYMPPHILTRLLNAIFGPDGWDGPIIVGEQVYRQWEPMKDRKGESKIWLTSEVTVEFRLRFRNERGHLTGGFKRIQATSGHMLAVNSAYNIPQMLGHLMQGAVTKASRAACKEIGTIFGSAVLKERKDVQGRPVQWRSLCVDSFNAIPWPSLPGIDSEMRAEEEFAAQAGDFAADEFDGADEDDTPREPQTIEPRQWTEPEPRRAAPAPHRPQPRPQPEPEPVQRWFVEYTNGDEHGRFTTNIEAVKADLERRGYEYTARPARQGDREYRRPRQDRGPQGETPSAPAQTQGESLRDAAVAIIRENPEVMVRLFQDVTGKKTAAIGTLGDDALGRFIEAAHAHDASVPA